MRANKYLRSRYVRAGGIVKRGVFADHCLEVRAILRLYWPRFPWSGPSLPLDRGTLTAKKYRRAKRWAMQFSKKKI